MLSSFTDFFASHFATLLTNEESMHSLAEPIPRKRASSPFPDVSKDRTNDSNLPVKGSQFQNKICWQFQQHGFCCRNNCRFSHEYTYGVIRINQVCIQWLNGGTCRYGPRCWRSHSLQCQPALSTASTEDIPSTIYCT